MRKVLLFLGILDDSDVEWMLGVGSRREVAVGDELVREGQPLDSVFLVIDGALSVRTRALGGREVVRLLSGEVVGEMSFVDSRPPSASVIAVESSTVLAIPRSLLSERLAEDQSFAARFYRALAMFLADRLRTTVSQMGYGKEDAGKPEEEEMDAEVLDNLALAANRFDELQRRLRGAGARS